MTYKTTHETGHLLVVDDNKVNRLLLGAALSSRVTRLKWQRMGDRHWKC